MLANFLNRPSWIQNFNIPTFRAITVSMVIVLANLAYNTGTVDREVAGLSFTVDNVVYP